MEVPWHSMLLVFEDGLIASCCLKTRWFAFMAVIFHRSDPSVTIFSACMTHWCSVLNRSSTIGDYRGHHLFLPSSPLVLHGFFFLTLHMIKSIVLLCIVSTLRDIVSDKDIQRTSPLALSSSSTVHTHSRPPQTFYSDLGVNQLSSRHLSDLCTQPSDEDTQFSTRRRRVQYDFVK